MIQVHTRYGYGKYAQTQTTAGSSSVLGPVSNLKAVLDNKIQTLVHLSWQAPSNSSLVQVKKVKTFEMRT